MLKIGYILTPIEFGGSEKVNLTFLNHVDRSLFDIYPVFLTRPWEKDNFFIQGLQDRYSVFKLPVAVRPKSEGNDYFRIIRCFKKLYSFLSEKKIQLIHTHGYFADIIGVPAAKLLRIPHISTCHGFISNDRNLVMYNRLDRMVLRFSDKIIAVSGQIKDDLVRSRINKSKITVIQNAVQATHANDQSVINRQKKRRSLAVKDEEFVVGYVGRLSNEKGIKYLLKAGMELRKKSLAFKIILIGDGPDHDKLTAFVHQNNLQEDVVFTGFQEKPETFLPAFDIFVLPSLTEGTPMAMLEAMSYGLPVVASRVGGIPDVISHNVDGMLVSSGDSRDLAKAIMVLSRDQRLRKSISDNAREKIRDNYGIAPWCKEIESLYCSAASGRDEQRSSCGEVGV